MTPRPDYSHHQRVYAADPKAPGWNSQEVDAEVLLYVWELLTAARIAPPARILEIGCGMGNLSIPLAQSGYDVAGIDVSATAITAAAERARATGAAAACFQVGDVTRPHSLRGLGEFDCVIDGLCWHCIIGADRSRLLTMVRGVLRPAGCFLAVTMFGDPRSAILRNRFDPATRLIVSGDIAQRHLGEAEALLTELRAAGFEIAYERRVAGRDDTGDQDMLLAVARSKQPE